VNLTKEQLAQLAELVRTTPEQSAPVVFHAVRYNLALFLWGLQDAAKTIEAITLACNHNREDNIVQRIGLDGLEKIRGHRLVEVSQYSNFGFVVAVKSEEGES